MLLKFSRFQNFAHRAMQKIALLGFAVLSLGLVSEVSFGQPIEQERKLARLEATYISHLSKYIQWDDNSSGSSLKIIIHGDDRVKFKDTLEYVMKISSPELAFELLEFSNKQTDKALLEIRKEVVDLSIEVAEKIIKNTVSKEDNAKIIDESLTNLKNYEA